MDRNYFIKIVKPYSMTSESRILELYFSLENIRENNIEGDFVECGVWKGGNILGIIEYLQYYKMFERKVWLYDTFNGMTDPEEIDVNYNNIKAADIIDSVKCYCNIDNVKQILNRSNFSKDNINYVVGDVCETLDLKNNLPEKISLLRLDTDWYKSTKKELEILYPKVVKNGHLIVDDYGHWRGAKKAVNEYFENKSIKIKKIDYTGIKILKEY